jgi:hypothetical protein
MKWLLLGDATSFFNKNNVLNGLEKAFENSPEVSTNFYRDKKMRSDEHLYVTFCYNEAMFVIMNAEHNTASRTKTAIPKNKTSETYV